MLVFAVLKTLEQDAGVPPFTDGGSAHATVQSLLRSRADGTNTSTVQGREVARRTSPLGIFTLILRSGVEIFLKNGTCPSRFILPFQGSMKVVGVFLLRAVP